MSSAPTISVIRPLSRRLSVSMIHATCQRASRPLGRVVGEWTGSGRMAPGTLSPLKTKKVEADPILQGTFPIVRQYSSRPDTGCYDNPN